MHSPLNLEAFRLLSLEMIDNQDFEPDQETDSKQLTINLDFAKNPEKNEFLVTLGINLTPEGDPSHFRFQKLNVFCQGLFSLPDDTAEDLVRQLVPLNCWAILHGILRGIVAQVTGVTDKGIFLLPTVNFVEEFKRLIEESATEIKSQNGRKKRTRKKSIPKPEETPEE